MPAGPEVNVSEPLSSSISAEVNGALEMFDRLEQQRDVRLVAGDGAGHGGRDVLVALVRDVDHALAGQRAGDDGRVGRALRQHGDADALHAVAAGVGHRGDVVGERPHRAAGARRSSRPAASSASTTICTSSVASTLQAGVPVGRGVVDPDAGDLRRAGGLGERERDGLAELAGRAAARLGGIGERDRLADGEQVGGRGVGGVTLPTIATLP